MVIKISMNTSGLSNLEKSKLLLQMGLLFMLMIIVGTSGNPKSLTWLFTRSDNYLQREGRIISSKIGAGGAWGAWRFEISYEYKIGNQTFTSERVHFGYQALSDKSYAQGYVDKYFVGKKVVVFMIPAIQANLY